MCQNVAIQPTHDSILFKKKGRIMMKRNVVESTMLIAFISVGIFHENM